MKTKAQVKLAARMAHRAGFTFPAKPFVQPRSNTAERTVSEPALYNAPLVGHAFGAFDIHHAATPMIQTKLKVGPVNDHYEQEADRVAQQVVGQINQPAMQRQEMPEEEEELQTKPVADSIQRQDELEEEEVQTKPQLQRRADGSMAAPPAVEGAIHQARGSGQALSDATRQPMERAFGADFSHVKVHTDAQADQLNRSIQARAFTTGSDIFFRQGEHSPGTRAGQELLAHELTHVVQQNEKQRPKQEGQEDKLQEKPKNTLQRSNGKLPVPAGPAYQRGKQVAPNFVLNKPPATRSNVDASTTSASNPTFLGKVAVDAKQGKWRYELDSVEAKGTIQIVYFSQDRYPAPVPTDDSGALTNVTQANWKKIVKDLNKNKAGIPDFWSAYRAEDVHENYHWQNEWQVLMKKALRHAEKSITKLGVTFAAAATLPVAETTLKPAAAKIFDDAMKDARTKWGAMGDSPGDPPYKVQVPVIKALVGRVKAHAKSQKWK